MRTVRPTENRPELWRMSIPFAQAKDHKHTRGHAVVIGGGIEMTGAARMSAYAAMRAGAGLATILCDRASLPVYAKAMLSVMTRVIRNKKSLLAFTVSEKHHAFLIGPGAGISRRTKDFTLALLTSDKPCVLDADALTVFQDDPRALFAAIRKKNRAVILTPHRAEFERLFGKVSDSVADARNAAKRSGAYIVLKGSKTVIAAPDGAYRVNNHAAPDLATAGSGDVLAGMILSFLAQGVDAFDAASAAVWLHGDIGITLGTGMIAEDIIDAIPDAMKRLKRTRGK